MDARAFPRPEEAELGRPRASRLTVPAMLLAGLSLSGCALVFRGDKQDVRFVSVPEGAEVKADGHPLGTTPTVTKVDRARPPAVVVSKAGFADGHVNLHQRPATGWWIWDLGTCVIPITLCIPVLLDALSGAWMTLDDEVQVKLAPATSPPTPPPTAPSPSAPPSATPAPPQGEVWL